MYFEPSYTRLACKESSESEAPLLDTDIPLGRHRRKTFQRQLHWLFHGFSCAIIIGLSAGLYIAIQTSRVKCWDMFNYYCKIQPVLIVSVSCNICTDFIAPVNEAVVRKPYIHQQFNGSLWYKSAFKGPPTPEVEAAWYDVMKCTLVENASRQ